MKMLRNIFTVLIMTLALFACKPEVQFLFAPQASTDVAYTNADSVTFQWAKVAHAQYYLYKIDEGKWQKTDKLSVKIAGLKPGVHKLFVKAVCDVEKDKKTVQLVSDEASFQIVIDQEAPQTPVFNPEPGVTEEGQLIAEVTNQVSPKWRWSVEAGVDFVAYSLASDNPDLGPMVEETVVSGKTVDFVLPRVYSDKMNEIYASIQEEDTPEVKAKKSQFTFTLSVKAGDLAGNWSAVAQKPIMVDLSAFPAPKVTNKFPNSDDAIKDFTNSKKPTWKWTDPSSDPQNNPSKKFRYQLDTQVESFWHEVGPKDNEFTPEYDLVDGPHTLYVQSLNALENGSDGQWSPIGAYTITIDTVGPTVPTLGAKDNIQLTNTQPVWIWSVTNIADVKKFIWQLDANPEQELVSQENVFEYNTDGLIANFQLDGSADGVHTFKVKTVDALGNQSAFISYDIEINTRGDAAPIVALQDGKITDLGEVVTQNAMSIFTWTVADAKNVAKAWFVLDAANPNVLELAEWTEMTPSELKNKKIAFNNENGRARLTEGTHTLSVKTQNLQGNYSAVGTTTMTVDLTGPNPIAKESITGQGVTGNLRPTWTWPPVADAVEYKCALGDPNAHDTAWFYITEPTWGVSSDLEAAKTNEGKPYTFTVIAIDFVGNPSTATSVVTSISSNVPKAPTLTLVGQTPTNQLQPEWTWIMPEGVNVDTVSYKLMKGSEIIVEQVDQPKTTLSYKHNSNLGQAGKTIKYDFKVQIKNTVGIPSAVAESSVVIDLEGPKVVLFEEDNISGKVPSSKKISYRFKHPEANDVAQFEVDFNGVKTTFVTSDFANSVKRSADGKWDYSKEGAVFVLTIPEGSEITDGIQKFAVIAKDQFDNASAKAEWNEIQIDNSSLKAPILSIPKDGNLLKEVEKEIDGNTVTIHLMKTQKPVINWAPGAGENKSAVKSVRFRANGGSWTTESYDGVSATTIEPGKDYDIGQGMKAYEVSLRNEVGNWSKATVIYLSVDTVPPLPPMISSKGIDKASSNKTADVTPTWTIAYQGDSTEIAKVEVALTSGATAPSSWSDVPFEANRLPKNWAPSEPLSEGSWTLNVRVYDDAGNASDIAKCELIIDSTATNWGKPDAVSGITVTKGGYTNAIKVVWDADPEATHYDIYRMTKTQYQKGERKGTKIDRVAKKTEYIDKTVVAATEYYYRVKAMLVEGSLETEGAFTQSFDTEAALGFVLQKPEGFVVKRNNKDLKFKLEWEKNPSPDVVYAIFKMGPFNDALSDAEIEGKPITDWKYMAKGTESWISCSDTMKLSDVNAISANNFVDNSDAEAFKFYYYQLVAFNKKTSVSNADSTLKTFADPILSAGFIMELDVSTWLSASSSLQPANAKDPAYGKVKLTVNVPSDAKKYLNSLDIHVERTYRYGGGYQGHFATRKDKSNHTNLTKPDPTSGPWEKTIQLEYPFDTAALNNGPIIQYDTMYDVDDNGNKLIAALDGGVAVAGWDGAKMWYERTTAEMDGQWEVVKDPDGKNSEMEFHYLIWDWVFRKAMNHMGNPNQAANKFARVDIKDMISGDYRIVVKHKNPLITEKLYGPIVKGTPALTPREFCFMVMILREITFYRIQISYKDEHEEMGVSAAGDAKANETKNGAISGTISKTNGGFNLGQLAASADVFTSAGGIEEFPGVKLELNWRPMKLMLGGDPKQCMYKNDHQMKITTPVGSGTVAMDCFMYGGTYLHGVGQGTNFFINYSCFNDLNQPVSTWQNQAKGWMPLEYLCDGFSWKRTAGSNASNYFDRYTSINWSYGGKPYPGFH